MHGSSIDARYRAYLACLNDRRFDDLGEHLLDPVVHNDRHLRVAEFADLLRRDVDEIPDLHYDAELVLVDGDHVACRIRFDCTPTGFRGLPPAKEKISFVEHVFYEYRAGRIARIWSLIDMDGIRAQLAR
ncbi:ester cyclase [Actinomycetospora termitidis]|uniref:Ester cyclase n=1 Tax=Actinomycetospora termitidis TaxID=3053470 RepID=A0ABT7M9M9_9PSEU|nr:ester cyclase [Actinomycetospora sp. Odt1-22]MDL5156118.1 ester cyclase [Actinomycetospora sp. Odt1-22]